MTYVTSKNRVSSGSVAGIIYILTWFMLRLCEITMDSLIDHITFTIEIQYAHNALKVISAYAYSLVDEIMSPIL